MHLFSTYMYFYYYEYIERKTAHGSHDKAMIYFCLQEAYFWMLEDSGMDKCCIYVLLCVK